MRWLMMIGSKMLKEPFIKVEVPQIGPLAGEEFDLKAYEKHLDKVLGIKERNLDHLSEKKKESIGSLLPYLDFNQKRNGMQKLESIVNLHPRVDSPCSMKLSDKKELAAHMFAAYQVSYAHYLLALDANIDGKKFPYSCCGVSTRNVTFSLIKFGYMNAAYAYSMIFDHAYAILPFVLEDNSYFSGELKGLILVDPTSDQLWRTPSKVVRNYCALKLGFKWEYITEYRGCSNLYPTDAFGLSHIIKQVERHALSLHPGFSSGNKGAVYHKGGFDAYLKSAFENTVPAPDIISSV